MSISKEPKNSIEKEVEEAARSPLARFWAEANPACPTEPRLKARAPDEPPAELKVEEGVCYRDYFGDTFSSEELCYLGRHFVGVEVASCLAMFPHDEV